MREPIYRPNRADFLLGPTSMVRGLAELYEARVAEMEGLVEGWDESVCTGERADDLAVLVCPDYLQKVSGGAAVAGGRRRSHVEPVEAHPLSVFAEAGRG